MSHFLIKYEGIKVYEIVSRDTVAYALETVSHIDLKLCRFVKYFITQSRKLCRILTCCNLLCFFPS